MSKLGLRDQLGNAHDRDETILTICLAERLISKGEGDDWVHHVYARSLIGIGRYEDAIEALDATELLSDNKHKPWIINSRGFLEECRGNFEAAIAFYQNAHAAKPDEASFLIYAGSLAFRLGRLSEAEDFARLGTECAKGSPEEAWYNLGGYLAAQQKYDESLLCYEKALEIDSKYKLAAKRRKELFTAFPEFRPQQTHAKPACAEKILDSKSKVFLDYCEQGRFEKLQELLASQTIDINVQDCDGCTGLQLAVGDRYRDVVNLLLKQNPDLSVKDNMGFTVFHWAILSGEKYYLDLFHGCKCEIEDPVKNGEYPIHLSITHREQSSLSWFIDKSVNIDVQDDHGNTALHYAVFGSLIDYGELLLANNARIDLVNENNETPLDIAVKTERFEFAECLQRHRNHD